MGKCQESEPRCVRRYTSISPDCITKNMTITIYNSMKEAKASPSWPDNTPLRLAIYLLAWLSL